MNSHTVPQRLLEQFAYFDERTRSLRLWRYEKDRRPYWKASPETATTVDRHFASHEDASLEQHIERRLAYEVEDPVHCFLPDFVDPTFVLSPSQRSSMTRYVALLFNRSMARRRGTSHLQDVKIHALRKFLETDWQLLTVAAHWNLKAYFTGLSLGRLMTKEDVSRAALGLVEEHQSPTAEQEAFAGSIVRAMEVFDRKTFRGEWRTVRTEAEHPFIISDSPVVTFERLADGRLNMGLGFSRPNVEVILPLSPAVALHVLPDVKRTRPVLAPSSGDVNRLQAAFAFRACYGNVEDPDIDHIVQQYISTVQIGKNAFTVWHVNYDNAFYEHLMRV